MQDNKKAYSTEKHRLAIINIILSPAILFLFIAISLPTYLKNFALSLSPNNYVNLLAFFALISVVYYITTLPLRYYSDFFLEHKYSLSNQRLGDWIKREIKSGVVSFVISIPLIFLLYAFLRYRPLDWWFLTALSWFFISILVSKFAPLLIVPLFYKYTPIKNTGLRGKLVKLASKVGFKIDDVYEINMSKDTKKANAALMGLGNQKRIVLCDTLLENFNEDEIESVMGHELGHHKMRHTLKLILCGGILTILTFFVTNIAFLGMHKIAGYSLLSYVESLVLIYAIISSVGIFTLPIRNAFSRKLEQEADMFTLKITGNKRAFVSTMKKLMNQNLSDPDPRKFYEIMLYSHPPISRRISFAESFGTEK